jgi:energy-coupling factor transporter ATP-binding protein EcfA2
VAAGAARQGAARDLATLADHLDTCRFAATPDPGPHRRRAASTAALLRSVVARAADPDAPLVVVVAGGTGAGKSTTVNTLAGARVAATSAVRPTTRAPVLVAHPDDVEGLAEGRLLAHLPRVLGADDAAGAGERLVVRTSAGLPAGLALVDTPDVDSVERANHRTAEDVLADADVWLWFVTGRTYADEVGAAYLRLARDRGVTLGLVVTQLREGERTEVLADAPRVLAREGVDLDLLADVPYATVTDDRLPPEAVATVHDFLADLAAPDERAAARRRAVTGVRASVPGELAPVAAALEAELVALERLTAAVDTAYADVPDELESELEHGIPLRAEVLDRWRDLVGGSERLLRVQTAAQRITGNVRSLLGVDPATAADRPQQVDAEIVTTVTDTVERLLERARDDARRRFERDPVGRTLLDDHPATRADDHAARRDRVRAAVETWHDDVAERVATVGGSRQVRARRWSTALNAVATTAILVLFTVSGGLTGGEVGIAALASAGSQALLVKLFGEQNLRQLLTEIHDDLRRRLADLIVADRADVDALLRDAAPDPVAVDAVRRAVDGAWPRP